MELILQAIKSLFRKIELSRTHYDTRESSSIVWKKTYDSPLEEAGLEKIIDGALDLNTLVGLDVKETRQYENLVGETVTETYSFHSDSDTVKLYDHSNDYGLPEGSYVRLEFESFEEDDEYTLIYLATTEAAMSLGITDIGLYTEVYAGDISYSITIAVKSGELKKLDEKYIPDSVYKGIETAQTTANSAQTTSNSAQTTANLAQTTANLKMDNNNPTGTGSFSLNRKSGTTVGKNSFVCGSSNTASSEYSYAEGFTTTASGYCSHAEGQYTTASGGISHAEGYNTAASGAHSHAEGDNTRAFGMSSHAEGNRARATSSDDSISITTDTNKGYYTHAEGYGTVAYGRCSHAEGNGTKSSGNDSHTEGYGTIASGSSQHVQGKCNVDDTAGTYSHIIGNGTTTRSRSNAHTVDWSGNAWYAGDVYVGSTSGTNKDEGSKKLATEEYVDSKQSGTADTTLGITGASVGQIARITAVDSDGKPTAWEPVDLPSGGGGEDTWEFINYVKLTEDSGLVTFDKDSTGNPFCLKGVAVAIYSVAASTNTQNSFLKIKLNNKLAMDNQYGIRAVGNKARGCIFVDAEITKNVKTKTPMMYGNDNFNPIKDGKINNDLGLVGISGILQGTLYSSESPNGITKIDVTSALPDTQILGVDSEILIWGVRM